MIRIPSHLRRHPESGIFYFRLTVPERLRHIIRRREITQSLRTATKSAALVRVQKCYFDAMILLAEAENTMSEKKSDKKRDWSTESLKKNAQWPLGDSDQSDEPEEKHVATQIDDPAVHGKVTFTVKGADGKDQKITIERDDPAEEAEIVSRILSGGTAPLPLSNRPHGQQKNDNDMPLAGMTRLFLNEKKRSWSEKTHEENKAIYTLLKEVLRNPDVSTIGHKQANQFKNTLLQLPPNRTKGDYAGKSIKEILKMKPSKKMSVGSVNKYLRRTASMFTWAMKHGHALENPFSGIGLSEKRQAHEQRNRFTQNDLSTLFAAVRVDRDKFKHSYQFFLPYLGLYTGARIEELCQLHLSDIRQEGDIWVIDINDEDDKKLKTQAARRLLPIHPKLIEIGFLERVEKLQKRNDHRLFPELKKMRDGYSQSASKWFGRYRTRCGIKESFHSFRHTFIDELKQRDADHTKIAALVGHKDESMTGGRYGKPYNPDVLLPVVSILDFEV